MVENECLPSKMKVSAVAAEMMLSSEVNLQALHEATGIEITDKVVEGICEANSRITKLDLTSCKKISDFSLVTVGNCCKGLRSISIGGCENVRHVGLRSLAMNCRLLRSIDFVGYNIDDPGLRIIAASLDKLEDLDLTGCSSITDRGLSQIAHCCTNLRRLKLGGCYKIGESGVWAFYELENCPDLEEVELFGCIYLSDSALLAIARRCPSLRKINVSKCPEISTRAICKLVSISTRLTDFVVSDCHQAIDDDVLSHVIQNLSDNLVRLDVSYCDLSENEMVKKISQCSNLKFLNLSGYPVDDELVADFAKSLVHLESLELFESIISNQSIELLSPKEGGAGLSYLGLTNCGNIDEVYLRQIATRFKFSTLEYSVRFIGFVPRKFEHELRKSAQIHHDRYVGSIVIQRFVRGMLVRIGIYKTRRDEWAVYRGFLQLQARCRGMRSREDTKKLRVFMREAEAAAKLASSFRGYQARKRYKLYQFTKMVEKKRNIASVTLQNFYRSHRAQLILNHLKKQKVEENLKQMEDIIMRNKAAIRIQSNTKRLLARNLLRNLMSLKKAENLLQQRKLSSICLIQRVFRGHKGRMHAKNCRYKQYQIEEEWFHSRRIQSFWRGMMGRRIFKEKAYLEELKQNEHRAKQIQKVWRAFLGKRQAKFMLGLKKLHEKEVQAALLIQRVYRGDRGRQKALSENKNIRRQIKEMKASKLIQRVYRGYKGRELAHVTSGLKSIQSQTNPLKESIEKKQVALKDQTEKNQSAKIAKDQLETEMNLLQKDLVVTREKKSLFIDSSILNGAPQRCSKEVVMNALESKIQCKREEISRVESICAEISLTEKEIIKEIKRLRRKLTVLTTSTTNRIKANRMKHLRTFSS